MDIFIPSLARRQDAASSLPSIDFSSSTLILPIVSLANVSQLCSDLLIHTLGLQSVGSLSGRYSIPVAVPADYVDGATDGQASTSRRPGLSTAIEVFQSQDASLTLIQQRSPVLKSRKDDFVSALATFIREARFKRVVVLAGTDAGVSRQGADWDDPSPFRFISSQNSSLEENLRSTMKPLAAAPSSSDPDAQLLLPVIPASGVTRRLLAALLDKGQASSTPTDAAAILMQVAEGDNRYDAHVFARVVDKVLGLQVDPEKWVEPVSWKVGLYGRELGDAGTDRSGPSELYG